MKVQTRLRPYETIVESIILIGKFNRPIAMFEGVKNIRFVRLLPPVKLSYEDYTISAL